MSDFSSILSMISNMIIYILSVRIPLGSDYSISFGSVAIGCVFFIVLSHIPRWIFGAYVNVEKNSRSKGGDK